MKLDKFSQSIDFLQDFLGGGQDQIARSVELRQNMVTFLRFIQNNKVVGTQTVGNMPLKMIDQLSGEMVNPPALESEIGDTVYKIRSEDEVWEIHFLHILAEVGNFVNFFKGKQWKLKPGATKYLKNPPLIQLWHLVMIWWHRTNWLVAYPIEGMGDKLPLDFREITLEKLLLNIDSRSIGFEKFADSLIARTGLTWTSGNTSIHRMLLHVAIKRMVIDINEEFGIINTEYHDDLENNHRSRELKAFKLTPLGKILINAVGISYL